MKRIRELISKCTGFEWDSGNLYKNWIAHNVYYFEIEQAIINRPIVFLEDDRHSHSEERFSALGSTDANRLLAIVFTIRGDQIRPISGRDMNLEEKRLFYEEGY
jgi:uncharacterized DUF497 family protein